MGAEPVQLARDHQQLAGRPEPVDIPGGDLHDRRRGSAAAGRGEEILERGQVMATCDAARSQHAQRH